MDHVDVAVEERTIQVGLSALDYFKTHPVLNGDRERAAQIEAAIRTLVTQRDRYMSDVLELRQEWDRIFEGGVSLREARLRSTRKPWWRFWRA